MNGTCLFGWGKGGGSVVCSKGCSNLFSCHRQLKGEENEERSGALILDALKEFLDLFCCNYGTFPPLVPFRGGQSPFARAGKESSSTVGPV